MFIKITAATIWFLITGKTLFFWVWLWQLKEYHWGRFKAHFETRAVPKIIAGFWRLKIPKITKKIILLLFFGLALEILFLISVFPLEQVRFYNCLFLFFIFSPLIFSTMILIFQMPTEILKKRILKKAQKKMFGFKNLLVIGITGSYGKTGTKEFLAEILSAKFKVLKTERHTNAEIGIARTILEKLKPEHEIFIAEIGAYQKGKIEEVCHLIKPKIGILTGLNEQHMSTFGSQENIIKAKFELIESLPGNGLAVLNNNDPKIKNEKLKIKNYHEKLKIKLTEGLPNIYQEAASRLFPWDIENLLMAIATAEHLGMSSKDITEAVRKIKSATEIKKGINGLNIIDNTYSANPRSVMAHLSYLKNLPAKKIIVMSCLIELGRAASEIHKRIGEKIAEVCDLAIITTKDYFSEIKGAVLEAGKSEDQIIFSAKAEEIFQKIRQVAPEGGTVLLESRVPQKLIDLLLK